MLGSGSDARVTTEGRLEIGDVEDLRYPIGEFQPPARVTTAERESHIEQVELLPAQLRAAVAGLDSTQLDTAYREAGWTLRQVVHHLADSHMNGFVRFRLVLTEDEPLIKPYAPDLWGELADSRTSPVEVSLALLSALHERWVRLLRALDDEQWARRGRQPELGPQSLDVTLAKYAWHGAHHVAHITGLRQRRGW